MSSALKAATGALTALASKIPNKGTAATVAVAATVVAAGVNVVADVVRKRAENKAAGGANSAFDASDPRSQLSPRQQKKLERHEAKQAALQQAYAHRANQARMAVMGQPTEVAYEKNKVYAEHAVGVAAASWANVALGHSVAWARANAPMTAEQEKEFFTDLKVLTECVDAARRDNKDPVELKQEQLGRAHALAKKYGERIPEELRLADPAPTQPEPWMELQTPAEQFVFLNRGYARHTAVDGLRLLIRSRTGADDTWAPENQGPWLDELKELSRNLNEALTSTGVDLKTNVDNMRYHVRDKLQPLAGVDPNQQAVRLPGQGPMDFT